MHAHIDTHENAPRGAECVHHMRSTNADRPPTSGKRDPSAQERCGAREKEKRIKGGARREPRAFPRVCVCAEPERTREGNGA